MSIVCCSYQVAAHPKEIIDGAVDGEKALDLSKGFKAAYVAFALASGLVGDLSPVVSVLRSAVMDGGVGGSMRRLITAQFIGDQAIGDVL